MTAVELLTALQRQGFLLTPLPDGKLEMRPASKLTAALEEELKAHKDELLSLLAQPISPWPCPRCGNPAEIDDVCRSFDGERLLTLWHCEPCRTVGVTPMQSVSRQCG